MFEAFPGQLKATEAKLGGALKYFGCRQVAVLTV
jgi:hypothetical protein